MKGLIWKGYLQEPTFQNALNLLNELEWNLTWKEVNQQWWIWGGDQLLYVGNSADEIEAFICGMAFTYATLPSDILQKVKHIISN